VTSFFAHYRTDRPAPVEYHVCRDMSCRLAGAAAAVSDLVDRHGAAAVREVHCLGRCDRAPAVCVAEHPPADPGLSPEAVADRAARARPGDGHEPARYVRYPDVDADADGQRAHTDAGWAIDLGAAGEPRFAAVRDFAARLAAGRVGWTPRPAPRPADRVRGYDQVRPYAEAAHPPAVGDLLRELDASRLRGMGGAGQPAFEKWVDVLLADGPVKYVVANGDESEPGAFKDREVMGRLAHQVVEGVALAGLALGAERGYVFVRHEYPAQIRALRRAAAELAATGVAGPFRVDVFESPGGYVCGEQSALLEAMEDRRAQPRPKPPDVATNGLWDRPTLVGNVETFAWVPVVARRGGGAAYAGLGHPAPGRKEPYQGARLLSVSGDVERPGVYEVRVGEPFGSLLDRAGGVRGGRGLRAVATGGASGSFVPAALPDGRGVRDVPLDVNEFRRLEAACPGAMLATGLVVFDDTRPMADAAVNCLQFFRDESCGKCVPCRVGTEKLLRLGTALLADGTRPDSGPLADLVDAMEATSICSLGASAHRPLTSVLRHFPPAGAADGRD
jgi:NADH:ubiquinone oxidoreductase subunit F (NADH-binding)